MVGLIGGLFLGAVAVGLGSSLLGYVSYRRWSEPGTTAFALFLCLWGLVPALAIGVGVLSESLSAAVQILLWCLATLCWFLFALQYTGTVTRIRPAVAGMLAAPSLVVVPWLWDGIGGGAALEAGATLVMTGYSGLAIIGAALVVRVTRNYGHLTSRHGGLLVLVGIVPTITTTAFGIVVDAGGVTVLPASLFVVGFAIVFVAAGAVLFRFGMFETTLAAGTIGEQAIARESDDLILIVDDDERVLKLNDAAVNALDVDRVGALGNSLGAVLGHDVDELGRRETVDIQTRQGTRTVDAQVTALTDQHDRRLGWIATLRDVTEREIRRQRLGVLNRVMRHNLRNQISVIEAHGEVLDEAVDEELVTHVEAITESADSLARLGEKVKTVEGIVDTDREPTTVHLEELVESVVASCREQWPDATITYRSPGDVTVDVDRTAVEFLLVTLLETVIEHVDAADPAVEMRPTYDETATHPVTVEVEIDDGRLPEWEVHVVETGTETPLKHGNGVGFWVVNWTASDLGGELSFPESQLVRVRLPVPVASK